MAELPDVYSDQFSMLLGPYGCSLIFGVTQAPPGPEAGSVPVVAPVATVRMSMEHLKAIAFVMHQQVLEYQKLLGIRVPMPDRALVNLKISRNDWNAFWEEAQDAP